MEQILQPTPSLLTSSTSPSSLHCPFNQLPSPPSSSSMILFALPRPYFPSPHMLVATQLFFSLWSCLSFFPSSRGQTSPTNPSTCKSARLAKISSLGGEIYDSENVEQREKGIEVEYEVFIIHNEDNPHTLYQKETSFQTRSTKSRILNKMLPNLRNLPTSN